MKKPGGPPSRMAGSAPGGPAARGPRPTAPESAGILTLQRTIGNRAARSLLDATPDRRGSATGAAARDPRRPDTRLADLPGQPLPARFHHLLGGRASLASVVRARIADVGAAGASEGREIAVRSDDRTARSEATWAHEIAHVLQRETPGLPRADVHTAELDAQAFARSAAAGRSPRVHVAAPADRLLDDDEPRAWIPVVVRVDREMDADEFARELLRQRYGVYAAALADRILAEITDPGTPLLPPGFRVTAADVKAGQKRLRIPEDLDMLVEYEFGVGAIGIHAGPDGPVTPGQLSTEPYSKELAAVVARLQTLLGWGFTIVKEEDLARLGRIRSEVERLTAAELAEFRARAVPTDDLDAFERALRAFLADKAFAKLPRTERAKINAEADRQYWLALQGGPRRPDQKDLDPADPGDAANIAQWTAGRDAILALRLRLGEMPPATQDLLGDPVQYTPAQYAQLLRIAEKLGRFAPEDFTVCKMARMGPLGDLDRFEKFVDLFLARKAELKQAMDKVAASPAPPAPSGSPGAKAPATAPTGGQRPRSMQEALDASWQGFDDSRIAAMTEDERYAAAAAQRDEVVKAQFRYMKDHPGETALDFAKAATLQNSSETFDGIARDLQEAANGDANTFARWAAGMGAGAKLSGWMLAVAGVIYALSWLTGVGELATIAAFMTYMLASTVVLSAMESDLRLEAASQAKTPEEFRRQTTASGQAAFAVFLALGMLALGLAIRFIAKTYFPDAVARVSQTLERFRARLRLGGRLATLKAEFATEIGEQRQRLLAAGEQAKAGARASADAVDKLTIEEFTDKLEHGDDDLFRQAGAADGKKVPWRELAATPEGRTAIARYKAQLAEALRTTVLAEIDAEIKAHVGSVDQLIDEVNRATTREAAEAAIGRQEQFLGDEGVAQRGKAHEARVRDQAEQSALEYLEEETRKAEAERQRLADERAAAEADRQRVAAEEVEAERQRQAEAKEQAEREAREQAEREQAARETRAKPADGAERTAADDLAKKPAKQKAKQPQKTKEEIEREKALKDEISRKKKTKKEDYKPCFLAGTLVDTPGGPMAIETLRSGDPVIGKRPGEAPWPQPILRLRDGRTELVIHVRIGATTIETTAAHQFHVVDRGWVAARDLVPGDVLEGASGGDATVTAIDRVSLSAPAPTYNFGVPAEAYLVVAGEHRVLVHNDGLPDFARILYWVWGTPKVRMPSPDGEVEGVVDWDGKSVWKTTSKADVEAMMEFRVKVQNRGLEDKHGFWTEDQIAGVDGLQNVKTPSELALVERLDHHSLRPRGAPPDASELSRPQLTELQGLIDKLPEPQSVKPWELQGTC